MQHQNGVGLTGLEGMTDFCVAVHPITASDRRMLEEERFCAEEFYERSQELFDSSRPERWTITHCAYAHAIIAGMYDDLSDLIDRYKLDTIRTTMCKHSEAFHLFTRLRSTPVYDWFDAPSRCVSLSKELEGWSTLHDMQQNPAHKAWLRTKELIRPRGTWQTFYHTVKCLLTCCILEVLENWVLYKALVIAKAIDYRQENSLQSMLTHGMRHAMGLQPIAQELVDMYACLPGHNPHGCHLEWPKVCGKSAQEVYIKFIDDMMNYMTVDKDRFDRAFTAAVTIKLNQPQLSDSLKKMWTDRLDQAIDGTGGRVGWYDLRMKAFLLDVMVGVEDKWSLPPGGAVWGNSFGSWLEQSKMVWTMNCPYAGDCYVVNQDMECVRAPKWMAARAGIAHGNGSMFDNFVENLASYDDICTLEYQHRGGYKAVPLRRLPHALPLDIQPQGGRKGWEDAPVFGLRKSCPGNVQKNEPVQTGPSPIKEKEREQTRKRNWCRDNKDRWQRRSLSGNGVQPQFNPLSFRHRVSLSGETMSAFEDMIRNTLEHANVPEAVRNMGNAASSSSGLFDSMGKLCQVVVKVVVPACVGVFMMRSDNRIIKGVGSATVLISLIRALVPAGLYRHLVSIIEPPAVQAQSDANVVESVAKVITTCLAWFACKGRNVGETSMNAMRALGSIPRTFEGTQQLSEWIVKAVEKVVNWLREIWGMDTVRLLKSGRDDIERWVDSVVKLHTDIATGKFTPTVDTIGYVQALKSEGGALAQRYKFDRKMTGFMLDAMRKIDSIMAQYKPVLQMAQGVRNEPVVIGLQGKSGVGKSILADLLAKEILVRTSTSERLEQLGGVQFISKDIYQRGTSEYWTGYFDQRMMVEDDWGQSVPVAGSGEDSFHMLIKMANCWPVPLNMADIESKGTAWFRSEFILLTTNLTERQFHESCSKVVIEPRAVSRRLNFCYTVRPKLEWVKPGMSQDDHCSLDTDKCLRTFGVGKIDTCVWEFVPFSFERPEGGSSLGPPISYDELVDQIVHRYIMNKRIHKTRVEDVDNRLERLLGNDDEEEVGTHPVDVQPQFNPLRIFKRKNKDYDPFLDPDGNEYKYPVEDTAKAALGAMSALAGRIKAHTRGLVDKWWTWVTKNEYTAGVKLGLSYLILMAALPLVIQGILGLLSLPSKIFGRSSSSTPELDENGKPQTFQVNVDAFNELRKKKKPVQEAMADLLRCVHSKDLKYAKELGEEGDVATTVVIPPQAIVNAYARYTALMESKGIQVHNKATEQVAVVELGGSVTANTWKHHQEALGSKSGYKKSWTTEDVDKIMKQSNDRQSASGRIETVTLPKVFTAMDQDIVYREGKDLQPQADRFTHEAAQKCNANVFILRIFTKMGPDASFSDYGMVTFVRDRWMLVNKHFIAGMNHSIAIGELTEDSIVELISGTQSEYRCTWQLGNFLRAVVEPVALRDTDMVMLKWPSMNSARDIVDTFVREDELLAAKRSLVRIETFRRASKKADDHYKIEKLAIITDGELDEKELEVPAQDGIKGYKIARAYMYRANTVQGDCGSPVYYDNKPAYQARRLLGFHAAGSPSLNMGWATIISQERLRKALEEVDPKMIVEAPLEEKRLNVVAQADKFRVAGSFQPLYKVGRPVYGPDKSSIVKTAMYGTFGPSKYRPALLSRLGDLDPRTNAILPYASPVTQYDEKSVRLAAHSYARLLSKETRYESRRLYTMKEAIEGDLFDPLCKGVPRKTSSGYPWSMAPGIAGKKAFFGTDGPYEFESDEYKELEERVNYVIENAKKGVRVMHVYQDFLKDECLKHEKVDIGKTRLISGAPIDYTIAFRMYFLAFTLAFQRTRIRNGSAIGINTHNMEWELLYKYLTSKGPAVVAGDYKGFDSSEQPQIHDAILDIINAWYALDPNDTEENRMVRRVLWKEVSFSRHINGDTIYQWNHSLPSGHPATSVINTMYNQIIFRMAWMLCGLPIEEFNEKVALIAYGDDNVANISTTCVADFNQHAIERAMKFLRMTYTNELKTGEVAAYRTIEEVAFLKRMFRYEKFAGFHVAPLELETITDMVNWSRNKRLVDEITEKNIEVALIELSIHPQEVWDYHAPHLAREALMRIGYVPLLPLKREEYLTASLESTDLW